MRRHCVASVALMSLTACASTPPPCPELQVAIPHSLLEQSVLHDQVPSLPDPARTWIEEYVLLRAGGQRICPASPK